MLKYLVYFLLIICSSGKASAQTIITQTYVDTIPGSKISFTLVKIPRGSFKMGSPESESSREADEGPQKKIQIDAFWMGAYEVTYDEYEVFMNDRKGEEVDAVTGPTTPYIDLTLGMGKQGGFPANSMSQYGALNYCYWLYKKTGDFYRLPTEAEWEYACRAGKQSAFINGTNEKNLHTFAWYAKNSENKYHKVGLLKPNAWGLYDMAGNVQEWTMDQYFADYFKKIENGTSNPVTKPESRHPRTLKGGSYLDQTYNLRSANRIRSDLAWNIRDPQIPRSVWWNADAPFVGFRLLKPVKKYTTKQIEQFYSVHLIK